MPDELTVFCALEQVYQVLLLFNYRLGHTKHPNTYTLSKALAEDVVHHFKDVLPTVIIRPSQVWSSVNEPFAGFVEGINSGIGIICGAMTGFIRSMYACEGANIKFSPADFVINATIVSAWKRSSASEGELLVYNCTDAETNPMEWAKASEIVFPYFLEYAPLEKLVWYPNFKFTTIYVWHMMCLFLFQILPATFFDLILLISGNKTM